MEDEAKEEAATYCVCGSEFTDNEDMKWIACDNPNGCPIEWFHIRCVGLTDETVPDDDWFCQQCRQTLGLDEVQPMQGQAGSGTGSTTLQSTLSSRGVPKKKKHRKPTEVADSQVFVCEICEEQFTQKEDCLEHKSKHLAMYNKSLQEKRLSVEGIPKDMPQEIDDSPNLPEPEVPAKRSRRSSSFGSRSDISQRSSNSLQSCKSESLSHQLGEHNNSVLSEEKRQFLRQFSDEEIIAELAKREEAFVCVCGILFEDQSLYYLHKGCHNTNNPKKCSFCGYEAKDYYDFTSHFFQHKNL